MFRDLESFEQQVYSQCGEDGVIAEIFERIGTTNKFFVEFGSKNGLLLSNTANLRLHAGWTGLLMDGNESEIEPVIVAAGRRGEGIGRALMETAIEESRQRGVNDVNIRPVARNASAIEAFHRLGFQTIGHVQLFMRLDGGGDWLPGIELHGQAFDH